MVATFTVNSEDDELHHLLKSNELSQLNQIIDQLPAQPTPDNLNVLFSRQAFPNLKIMKFYVTLILIVLTDLKSKSSRKAATKQFHEHKFHLCLKCSTFFSSKNDLHDHLQEFTKHKVSSEKVTTEYKEANKVYQEKKSSGRRRKALAVSRRRLLALAEVSCLEKMFS
jgi:hypothetical protein